MFEALVIGCLVVVSVVGGKEILAFLAEAPVIGAFASWYAGLVQPHVVDGVIANLIYGAMAAQVLIILLAVVIYGSRIIKQALAGPSNHEVVRRVGNWD